MHVCRLRPFNRRQDRNRLTGGSPAPTLTVLHPRHAVIADALRDDAPHVSMVLDVLGSLLDATTGMRVPQTRQLISEAMAALTEECGLMEGELI
jgi:hypothetical protein